MTTRNNKAEVIPQKNLVLVRLVVRTLVQVQADNSGGNCSVELKSSPSIIRLEALPNAAENSCSVEGLRFRPLLHENSAAGFTYAVVIKRSVTVAQGSKHQTRADLQPLVVRVAQGLEHNNSKLERLRCLAVKLRRCRLRTRQNIPGVLALLKPKQRFAEQDRMPER